jgi:hypothetical protein
MKSIQWQKLFSTLAILIFLTACGKDQNSGSSSSLSQQANPISQPNQILQGQAALDSAKKWYNSNYEPKTSLGARAETRVIETNRNSNNCSTSEFLGFIDFSICGGISSPSVKYESRTVMVDAQTVKSGNSKLANAFITQERTLVGASQRPSQFGGTLIELAYRKTNGHQLFYRIDTSFFSAFNPILIQDTETGRTEQIANLNLIR